VSWKVAARAVVEAERTGLHELVDRFRPGVQGVADLDSLLGLQVMELRQVWADYGAS
jgi:hypothetical protein